MNPKLRSRAFSAFTFLSALCVLAICAACIHRTTGTVSPWERVTTDNALLAQTNNAVEQGAEAVAASRLRTPEQIAPVIRECAQVANAHLQITAILEKGSSVSASDYDSIQALLQQIQASASQLISSGELGVKNPKTQNLLSSDVQALSSLASALVTELQAFRQNPAPPMTAPAISVPASRRGGPPASWLLLFGLAGMGVMGMAAAPASQLTPDLIAEIVALILQIGPLAIDFFEKLQPLLNLGPDEKANIANAIAASNAADADTIARVAAWMKANGLDFTPPASQG